MKNVGSQGTASKEMNYPKLPRFDVACIFESTEKRSREQRGVSEEEEAEAAAGVTVV